MLSSKHTNIMSRPFVHVALLLCLAQSASATEPNFFLEAGSRKLLASCTNPKSTAYPCCGQSDTQWCSCKSFEVCPSSTSGGTCTPCGASCSNGCAPKSLGACRCGVCPDKDVCGVCGGTGKNSNGCCGTQTKDCAAKCGGTSTVDVCGVCGGGGIPAGKCNCAGATTDVCGVCGGSGIPAGKCNCAGATTDACGVCGGPGLNANGCCGAQTKDVCGKCGGTGPTPCPFGQYTSGCGGGSAGVCASCSNAPSNAYYTGSGGTTNSCPWACNAGYAQSGSVCTVVPNPVPGPPPPKQGPQVSPPPPSPPPLKVAPLVSPPPPKLLSPPSPLPTPSKLSPPPTQSPPRTPSPPPHTPSNDGGSTPISAMSVPLTARTPDVWVIATLGTSAFLALVLAAGGRRRRTRD